MRRSAAGLIAAVVAITAIGAVLRLTGLARRDFWFDESCTFVYVDRLFDWPDDSSLWVQSTNLPYYVLLRGWVALFGDSEAAYRSMSAVAALLTVPVLALVAYRLRGAIAAIVCAALVAAHPLQIHYAHEARAYALWMLLLSLTLLALVGACRRGRARWWVLFGCSLLACLHLHYFTILWVPASAACVGLWPDGRRGARRWAVTVGIAVLAFLPYVFLAILPAARGGGGAWIASDWDPASAIPESLWALLPSGGYPAHLRGLSTASHDTVLTQPLWLIAIAWTAPAVIVAAMLVVVTLRARRGAAGGGPPDGAIAAVDHTALAALTLTPLALAWMYSYVVRPIYLPGRYDLVAWPGLMIWIAAIIVDTAGAITRRRRAAIAAAVCVALITCSAIPIARMAALRPGPSFHRVRADRLAQRSGADDLTVVFSYDRYYLLYYLHRAGFRGRVVSFPSWLDRQIGWLDTASDLDARRAGELGVDAARRVRLVLDALDAGGRAWMLWDSMDSRGRGPRATISVRFFDIAEAAGLQFDLVDPEVGIYAIQRSRVGPPRS